MYLEKCRLLKDFTEGRSCFVVRCGCVNRIRFWLLRRDDHSGVLIGAGWTWRCDWPARVKAVDVRATVSTYTLALAVQLIK